MTVNCLYPLRRPYNLLILLDHKVEPQTTKSARVASKTARNDKSIFIKGNGDIDIKFMSLIRKLRFSLVFFYCSFDGG